MKPILVRSGFLILLLCLCRPILGYSQSTLMQLPLQSLSEFKEGTQSWKISGKVSADIQRGNSFQIQQGMGILVNQPSSKGIGQDLFTKEEFGDVDLELEFMLTAGSNSGVYLQGRYEVQLSDSWGNVKPTFNTNGGIFERWWETQPQGKQGYDGIAPRQNVSKAPGVWQKLKVSFQAPRFDSQERKISNAVMKRVELNGVLIHDNVQLSGPTRGAVYETETPKGPLRFQGDHGAVAFRNIRITRYVTFRPDEKLSANSNETDPIYIDAKENIVMRSFMDLPGLPRVVHAVSVGTPENLHYTYDMDNGMIIQIWRGDFLNATPMWHDRGDGSSRPRGTVQRFGKPLPAFAILTNETSAWPTDTVGSSLRPKGYIINENGSPSFKYLIKNIEISDRSAVTEGGKGLKRDLKILNGPAGLYFKVASGSNIEEVSAGLYAVDDQSYFIQLDKFPGQKALLRNSLGRAELLLSASESISYSIIF